MVGSMVWDIAAVMLIVIAPLALVVSDCFGNTILAAMERRRRRTGLPATRRGSSQ
jgi:hypothetical protein